MARISGHLVVRVPVLLGVTLFFAGLAMAHPGDQFEALSAEKDNVTFYVTPQTLVVKAQREAILLGEASTIRNERYVPMANATWGVAARGPGEAKIEHQPYGYGFGARANFSAPGAWTIVVSANGTSVELPLQVYPPTSVRVEASALRSSNFYAGRAAKSSLYFVEDATGSLVREDATVTARVEKWENETKLGETEVTLAKGRSTGEFSFDHTFAEPGRYLVRVASAEHGIGYSDLPAFKLSVVEARSADPAEAPRETPGLIVPLALLAIVVATAQRRRS